MTRRFDRDGSRKHHVQSLCAMQHLDYNQRGTHAYEQLFLVARQLRLGDAAHTEIFRRMAFNVMARNCDDHTKNHAFPPRDAGRSAHDPASDVPPAFHPTVVRDDPARLSLNGRFQWITTAYTTAVATPIRVAGPPG